MLGCNRRNGNCDCCRPLCDSCYTKMTFVLHEAGLMPSWTLVELLGKSRMFELRNVTRKFGSKLAVDSVTLDIPQGQMVGIIGRSGAGKSTLLRMINRLNDVSSGSIHFGDLEV